MISSINAAFSLWFYLDVTEAKAALKAAFSFSTSLGLVNLIILLILSSSSVELKSVQFVGQTSSRLVFKAGDGNLCRAGTQSFWKTNLLAEERMKSSEICW